MSGETRIDHPQLHEFEIVDAEVRRFAVPGGWIYEFANLQPPSSELWNNWASDVRLQFVPDLGAAHVVTTKGDA